MGIEIAAVLLFTFVIHLIGTLSYAVRIVAARTGRIAVSLSLFNLLVLVSRTAGALQGPLLAKHVEQRIVAGTLTGVVLEFRWLLLVAAGATAAGALLIPSFQRLLGRAVEAFTFYRSVPRLFLHAFSKAGIRHLQTAIAVPASANLAGLADVRRLPLSVILANAAAESVLAIGGLAALYAGCLSPALRLTSSSLSAVVGGLAAVLLFTLIDPYLSVLTDEAVQGKVSDVFLRQLVVSLVGSRLAGVLLAQLLLLPAAHIIAWVAALI